jgi:hypothetical protein
MILLCLAIPFTEEITEFILLSCNSGGNAITVKSPQICQEHLSCWVCFKWLWLMSCNSFTWMGMLLELKGICCPQVASSASRNRYIVADSFDHAIANDSDEFTSSIFWHLKLFSPCGRAIAQAVSRRLPTSAARLRAQVRSCGICGGQSGTEAGFLRVLRFPLQILIPPAAPHSTSSINRAGTIGQLVADVPSGLSRTPPQETEKKNLSSSCFSKVQTFESGSHQFRLIILTNSDHVK